MKHLFKAKLSWSNAPIVANNEKKHYYKSHRIDIDHKNGLEISAAKAFKGDPALLNPEDLLLSSLTSCHMMSYLYVCQQQKIHLLSYLDESEAILETFPDGSGKIKKVILKPHVVIQQAQSIDLALSLHQEAAKLCFIANSCNFEIAYYPTCTSE